MNTKSVLLIIGASSPLGKAIVLELITKGHRVYAASRSANVTGLEGCTQLPIDITSEKTIKKALKSILSKEKEITGVINVAGVTLSGPTTSYSVEDFKKILDINVVGFFRLVKEAEQLTKKPKKILNITSLNSVLALPNFGLYCASKFAVDALGLSFRYELASDIEISNIVPGALKSESSKKITHKTAREKIPILRLLLPLTDQKDVAKVVSNTLERFHPPARILVGRDTKIIVFLQKVLPFSFIDKLIFFYWNKK